MSMKCLLKMYILLVGIDDCIPSSSQRKS
uniref:Uncharacterized protein n=1 Tax=Arundo donax TaxID=35708 RepID=A0A0A9T0Y9_ARUDO